MLRNEGVLTDNEDDNDDDDEVLEKPAPRTPSRALFGVEAVKDKDKKEESSRKLTLTGSMFERMGAKKSDDKEGEENTKKKRTSEEDTKTVEETRPVTAETEETNDNEKVDDNEEGDTSTSQKAAEDLPADALAEEVAVSWEAEEIKEEESTEEAKASESVRSEVEPDEPEFVDLPQYEHTEEPATPEDVEPELIDAGLGMEGPPEPPEHEPPAPAEDEPEEPPTATTGSSGPRDTGYGAAYHSPAPATIEGYSSKDLEEAENLGRRNGTRRGVGAGLLFGWLFGRHGKKKAAREHAKEMKAATTEISQLKSDQQLATERLSAVKSTQEQLRSKLALAEAEKLAEKKQLESKQRASETHAETLDKELKSAKEVLETSGKNREAFTEAVNSLKNIEKLPEEKAAEEADYQVKKGNRVETSAWHRIEVDAQTGKVVENPSVEYGDEYKSERSHEVKKEDQHTGLGSTASQLGGLAAAFGLGENSLNHTASASVVAPDDASVHEKQLKTGAQILHYTSKPLIWAVAVILVVVLFAFGLLR